MIITITVRKINEYAVLFSTTVPYFVLKKVIWKTFTSNKVISNKQYFIF